MENNENFVEQTENVEQTTEQTPKTYTQEEVNEIVGKRLARQEARIRKENDRKYGGLVEVLKAGTGKENVEEMTDTFKQFYQKKGIQIPEKPSYTEQDIEVLASHDADDIIRGGFEEVVEEADRLNAIGYENMTARDKALFVALTNHIKDTEASRELAKIGVTEDVYKSKDYKDFASQFNPNIPAEKVYDLYRKTQPQKEHRTMGSMKHTPTADTGIKEFYTRDESLKFTKADFDKNPALYKAVEESSYKW
jgi:hypothetical protein